jgi:SAM-dependent methyltransferase
MNAPDLCPLCKSPTPRSMHRTHTDGVEYTQYHCDACLVEFWWPLKNPGASWYQAHEKYGNRNTDPIWEPTANHKKVISYLAPMKGAVLDVGCGIGNFSMHAKKSGWEVGGIDFDPDAIASAKKVTGSNDFEVADIVSFAQQHPEKKYDLVTFFDVLEHVDNHNEFIDSIKKVLKPGGYIAMSMPYRKHALWLMKGDVPPNHLTCWDRTSLRRFLEARGFEVLSLQRSSEGVWPVVMKLRFKYGKAFSFNAVTAARKSVGGSDAATGKRPLRVRVIHSLAKIKDAVLFGIPALIIFIAMLPFPQRYIDLFAIARLKTQG